MCEQNYQGIVLTFLEGKMKQSKREFQLENTDFFIYEQ